MNRYKLVKLIRNERADGRRVFVYCQYTGIRDMTGRLNDILTDEGFKVDILKASTSPEKREEWLAERVAEGVEQIWKKINEKNQYRLFPGREAAEDKVVVVEFTQFMSKRKRRAERLTLRASDLDEMVQEKGVAAQLTLF